MLVLDRDAYDAVLDHVTEATPREACGVLAGQVSEGTRVVESAIRMHNVAAAPHVTYRIDPVSLLEVIDDLEAAGREVVGFYHAHPAGPATPSDRDRGDAQWGDHHYLVVSLAGPVPTLDAWLWTGEEFADDAVTFRG
ncbi:MAG: desampylase [Halobacteriaceae archaeon]